jgi:hypothetical protein
MNIFYTDSDPLIAAQNLCDQHVRKMPVESAQMLANLFSPEDLADAPRTAMGGIRKHSYQNHPCTKWIRESRANASWLIQHAVCMRVESALRFPHWKIIQSFEFIDWAAANFGRIKFDKTEPTEAPQCFGKYKDLCYVLNNPVAGYRLYYNFAKSSFAKWTWRKPPEWYVYMWEWTKKILVDNS